MTSKAKNLLVHLATVTRVLNWADNALTEYARENDLDINEPATAEEILLGDIAFHLQKSPELISAIHQLKSHWKEQK